MKSTKIIISSNNAVEWSKKCNRGRILVCEWCNAISHSKNSIVHYANNI
jgi:hypothetical protein